MFQYGLLRPQVLQLPRLVRPVSPNSQVFVRIRIGYRFFYKIEIEIEMK